MDTLNASPDIKAETKVQMLASLADSCNKTVAASRQVLPEASQLHHDGRGAAGWLHTREVPETRPSVRRGANAVQGGAGEGIRLGAS